MKNTIEYRLEGEFFFGKYLVEVVDLDIARHAVERRHELLKGERKLAIVDSGRVKKMTKEARKYLSEPFSYEGLRATAIIIRSPLAAVLGNFYLRFGNFPIPTRLFRDEESAKKWLLGLNV